MPRVRWFGFLCLLPLAAQAGTVELRRCAIEYERTSDVSVTLQAATSTVLKGVYVRPGDRVKAGQLLGRVEDADTRADLELRTAEAESDVDIRAETAKFAFEQAKFRRADALFRRNLLSPEDHDMAKITAEVAALRVEQAKHSQRMARIRQRQSEAQLRSREFVNPHDGVVSAILKNQGEMISSHEPVFRVDDDDHVRVVGFLDVGDAWRVHLGHRVKVTPEVEGADLEVEHDVFPGVVDYVDNRIDPMTRTCKVIARVDNLDHRLRSGLEARMSIDLEDATPSPPSAAPKAAGPGQPIPRTETASTGPAALPEKTKTK